MENITGQKFNKLIALEFSHKDKKSRKTFWLFKCDCGNKKILRGDTVKGGGAQSCGCLNKTYKRANLRHGMWNTKFYKIWVAMKCRCENSSDKQFGHYGGRGIRLEKKWTDFIGFKNDMYEGYQKHTLEYGGRNTSIDRINNDGNYCKKNCRWATQKEQTNNTRRNHKVKINGLTLNLTQWAKKLGINYKTIGSRIYTYGWDDKKALLTPVFISKRNH